MASVDWEFGVIFLFQVIIGTLGNFVLLCHYCILCFCGCRSRSTDVILRHLMLTNSIVILSRGVPETMAAFGLRHFLSDVGCKLVFYAHRVGRGVSMGNTCLLSVFQAFTISLRSSRWAELRVRALKCTGWSNSLCWVLHVLLNIRAPVLVTDKWNNRNVTKAIDFQYCACALPETYSGTSIYHDILCCVLLLWASGSMVFVLYRHEQRVHHIRRHSTSSGPSPGTRATQNILFLVSAFLLFYTLSSVIYGLFSLYNESTWWLTRTSAFINACFPTISPFILMSREVVFAGSFGRSEQMSQLSRHVTLSPFHALSRMNSNVPEP